MKIAPLFLKEDSEYLCSFSSALFSFLASNTIEIVIVSGAPLEILQEYQRMFPITTIYALKVQAINGRYLDTVQTNYGTAQAKQTIVTQFATSSMHRVVFAAGNSSSDLPLLNAAPAGIIVDKADLLPGSRYLHVSCEDTYEDKMHSFLEKEMAMQFYGDATS